MFHQSKHRTILDSKIADDAMDMVVIEKLAVLAVHCLSERRRQADDEGGGEAAAGAVETPDTCSQ